jgi:ubiquinone/menaquinone biosynthesis C-methylase UbiE
MLARIRSIADREQLRVECLAANLVQLDEIATGSCASAVCLFSTLGMIRGAEHRKKAVAEFHRILAPGGRLLVHAHQFWWNLRQYGGARWVVRHLADALVLRKTELGDRYATYRGVQNFYLHSFRAHELRRLLRGAGFQIEAMRAITGEGSGYLQAPMLLPALRAGGWLVSCRASRPA